MQRRRGFTLIEVLIVVIILGILATIAIPQFSNMVKRARLAEAWTNLAAIRTAQSVYYLDEDAYASAIGDLSDLQLMNPGTNFDYAVGHIGGDDETYNATATGVAGTAFDNISAWMSQDGANGSDY